MKYNILKRLEAIEQAAETKAKQLPLYVHIYYDESRRKYKVIEFFLTGKKAKEKPRTKEAYFDSYKDYIFKPFFKGGILLEAAEEGAPTLTACSASEVRRLAGLEDADAFSFGDVVTDQAPGRKEPTAAADIIEQKKG